MTLIAHVLTKMKNLFVIRYTLIFGQENMNDSKNANIVKTTVEYILSTESFNICSFDDLYDTTSMIQLVSTEIADSYKFDVQIFVSYNFWKIGWVLFLTTYMKEIDQLHFMFWNAELFWSKYSSVNGTWFRKFVFL